MGCSPWGRKESGTTERLTHNTTQHNTPLHWVSLVAQMVKNLPANQETQVQSLACEDPLEKEMATHSSILHGEFHGQRSPAGYTVHGVTKGRT